nr:nucleotidyltransferase domain-containing protein [uncultured Leptotrichia sp.]
MDKKYILEKLSKIDKNKYSISELGLFGSYAKNAENENSDIDVLVKMEFKKGMYQNFCNLQKELEEIFHKKVDLIEKSVFDYKFKTKNVREYKEKIREEILESVIYV